MQQSDSQDLVLQLLQLRRWRIRTGHPLLPDDRCGADGQGYRPGYGG